MQRNDDVISNDVFFIYRFSIIFRHPRFPTIVITKE